MIFVGDGGAEEGHDAIAQYLIDRSFKTVHGVHHVLQGGVDQPLRHFRVEAADQLRRVLEVGEEHCHLLAFAFQSAFQGEDLIGKVARGIGMRGTPGRAGGSVGGS
jgi:hypothetical protein